MGRESARRIPSVVILMQDGDEWEMERETRTYSSPQLTCDVDKPTGWANLTVTCDVPDRVFFVNHARQIIGLTLRRADDLLKVVGELQWFSAPHDADGKCTIELRYRERDCVVQRLIA